MFFGTYADEWFPSFECNPTAFAVTGLAAFFAAVVRAPVTGIILAIELTGSDSQLVSMIAASPDTVIASASPATAIDRSRGLLSPSPTTTSPRFGANPLSSARTSYFPGERFVAT